MKPLPSMLSTLALAALGACGDSATLPVEAGFGAKPELPAPNETLLPTVNIALPQGWTGDAQPTPAPGTRVNAFASGLDHPRWLHVLPNGDVLVAETNAPSGAGNGIRGWVAKKIMARAGAGVPSANRIILLRDADGDGVAESRSVFIDKLNSPFGIALVGNDLYIANTDGVLRFPYTPGAQRIDAAGTPVTDLPAGPLNHHWTKNIIASRDGSKLYATVGSNSNVGESGLDKEEGRAAIWEIDLKTGTKRLFATGLRNPNGMALEPVTGTLWTVANERDEIGSDLVPDYLTSVRDGGFYGWPYSYYGSHVDARVKPQRPDLVSKALAPDYALGAHTASLGLAFAEPGLRLPATFGTGAFIGQHGSWNRRPFSGYKVVFVPFGAGRPAGPPVDVLTGFLTEDGKARGRPVGVVQDRRGDLLVADDVGNVIWRVTGTARSPG